MITYPPGKLHLDKQETALQKILWIAAVLTAILLIAALAFAVVNAAMPSLAELRIQAAVNTLRRDVLDVQQQQARQELENAGEGAVPALVVALRSENPVLRRNAADMLGYIASPQSLAGLRYSLINDTEPQVRQNAARALGEIQDLSTLDTLQRAAVLDPSPIVHPTALDSIARFRARLALAAGVNAQDLGAFATVPGNSMNAYLAIRRDLILTNNGGKTWHTLAKSLPSLVTTLAVSPQDPKILYASADGLGLFKTMDGGRTWSAINSGLGVMPGARFSVTALAMDATNPQRIFVTTGVWIGTSNVEFFPIAVMRSMDSGTTWQVFQKTTNVEPITQLLLNGEYLYALAGEQVIIY